MNETVELTMPDSITVASLAGAALLGSALGAFYFGGLWWTVRRLARAPRPLALYFASLVIRTTVVGLALFVVMTFGDWSHACALLVGFMAARLAVTRWTGRIPRSHPAWQEAAG